MSATTVGPLVRHWRHRRSRSQLDVAYSVGVSPRHLSFVETGRSTPSPELIEALAVDLDIPLRERNALLLAAGFAPRYQRTALDDPAMGSVRASLLRLLDAHEPYPGLVVDREWNVVLANRGAGHLAAMVAPRLAGPPLNVFRASLHPDGMARHTLNFDEWAGYLLGQLHRLVLLTGDDRLAALEQEVNSYANVRDLRERVGWTNAGDVAELLVPCRLSVDGTTLSMFTTITAFGTPRDITLDELAVELFFPNDDATAAWFAAHAAG
jgi:transcriptional regulator with XRE-family HTH domain